MEGNLQGQVRTQSLTLCITEACGYLGSEVIGVASLCGCEVNAQHRFRHVDRDHQALHRLPHSLFGSHRDVQATTRSRLQETDVLLHVHRNGHETEEGSRRLLLSLCTECSCLMSNQCFHSKYSGELHPWRRHMYLLLRANMISHECEVSIWRDEREDVLRLPTLEAHTRVKTHVIQKPRILWPEGTTPSEFHTLTNKQTDQPDSVGHKAKRPTMKDSVRSGIPVSLTHASMTPWISANTVVPAHKRCVQGLKVHLCNGTEHTQH